MSHPWIIWTAPRTAGTALSAALKAVSERPTIADEPFQYGTSPQQFAWVYESWLKTAETEGLEAICKQHFVFKHIPESFEDDFNVALAEISMRYGYRHIRLYRRDWAAMLISRDIANQLNSWRVADAAKVHDDVLAGRRMLRPLNVPQLMADLRLGWWRWEKIKPHLRNIVEVTCEDLLGASRWGHLYRLTKHLGLNVDLGRIAYVLDQGDQDTQKLWKLIPNIDELRLAIEAERVA